MNSKKSPDVIKAMQEQLGIRCDYSNWWIARELLRVQWKHKPRVLRDTAFDLRELPFTSAARDILWRRDVLPHMIGWYCHHFDKNSQYLSAGRAVKTGVGNPVHLTEDIVPGLPGIYRVNATNVTAEFGLYLPDIIEQGQEWITNDVAIFASEHGYELDYLEAWVFEDYTKVLDKWSEKIWTTRQYFNPKLHRIPTLSLDVQQACYTEMKDIAVRGNGSWATGKDKMHERDRESLDLIHPNWWADVVGKSRVNMLANLLAYGSPVLIKTDGLWFITRDANPITAVTHNKSGQSIMARMNECGGYKYVSSFQVTQDVYEQSQGMTFHELSTFFKHMGGEK